MRELVTSNSHNNGVSVFHASKYNLYYKVASNKFSAEALKSESLGWKWYKEHFSIKHVNVNFFQLNIDYARLEINSLSGGKADYTDSLENNIGKISDFIEFYINKWPRKKNYCVHGDLTLSNILWDEKLYIVDWEHFQKRHDIFWGYDALYLLLSAILLPNKNFCIPNKKNLKQIGNFLFRLEKAGVDKNILEQPMGHIREVIKKLILPKSNCLPSKFFPLHYSELQVDVLDECLVRAYRYAVYNDYLGSLKV